MKKILTLTICLTSFCVVGCGSFVDATAERVCTKRVETVKQCEVRT